MIDRETWARIEAILDQALELPSDQLPALLDEQCAGDPGLRAEVEALLAADDESSGALESPAGDFAETLVAEAAAEMAPEHGSKEQLEGLQIGPYRVLRHLGGGGMGEVYVAIDTRLDRQVALKLLPRVWSSDHASKERFLREARAAAAFDHPNICTLHDLGETEDGQMYLVMAYYEGETLAQKLARGPLDLAEARDLTLQVGRGLERAHATGVTHRDVKPANVIVTPDGEAKILDFGIAKIAGDVGLTRTGMSPGTPAYMSPEQTRGEEVDGRTDVWSLGVMLWEMIAGQRAFAGKSVMEVYFAVQNHDPEPVERLRERVPEDLAHVASKATAKDAGERYASVTEMLADLELDAPTAVAGTPARDRRSTAWAAMILITVLTGLGGWWTWRGTSPVVPEPAQSTTVESEAKERPKIAILPFRNLTDDPELDWLRTGIVEMLVTDLGQSPDLEIMSAGRVARLLDNLETEETDPSLDRVRKVAETGAATAVIAGNFARAGDLFRIGVAIEDTTLGQSRSDQMQGEGEESLFALVDELSAEIRSVLRVTRPEGSPLTVQAATTGSLEAWRYYSEGRTAYHESRRAEATELLRQAVEVDPEFALALAALSTIHRNQNHPREADEYMARAFELADRLPLDDRYRIEATYLSKWATLDRGISIYEEALRVYPDRQSWRHNLASRYCYVERYDDAIREFSTLIEMGREYPGTYISTALAHGAVDRFDEGYDALVDFADARPENWYLQFGLGLHLTQWGRLEDATAAFGRAAELSTGEPFVHYGLWRLQVARQDWKGADLESAKLIGLPDSFARWRGSVSRARNVLYQGRSREAVKWLRDAVNAFPEPDALTALARCWLAEVWLARGEADQALAEAQRAQIEGRQEWPELLGLFLATLAHQELGRHPEADATAQALRDRLRRRPFPVEKRLLLRLEGSLALARGDGAAAVDSLTRAAALLSPRGVWWFHWQLYPDHVPIWYALGEAELSAGRDESARRWFEKVAVSGSEHVERPIPYVRSFYQLARILDRQEKSEESALRHQRFLDHWLEGDLDRQQVADATAEIRRLERSNVGDSDQGSIAGSGL